MRMGHGWRRSDDWAPFTEPPILWINTAMLVLGSVAMQWARARRDSDALDDPHGLAVAGALTSLSWSASSRVAGC